MPFSAGVYTRTKTFANGGTLLPTDLNSIQDDLGAESNLNATTWKTIRYGGGTIGAAMPTGEYTCTMVFSTSTLLSSGQVFNAFYFDPEDLSTPDPRTVRLRVRCWTLVGATAPAANFTFSLFPVTGISGSAYLLGAATATSLITAPAINTVTQTIGTEVTAPAAGFFVTSVNPSATTAASSSTACHIDIQARQF